MQAFVARKRQEKGNVFVFSPARHGYSTPSITGFGVGAETHSAGQFAGALRTFFAPSPSEISGSLKISVHRSAHGRHTLSLTQHTVRAHDKCCPADHQLVHARQVGVVHCLGSDSALVSHTSDSCQSALLVCAYSGHGRLAAGPGRSATVLAFVHEASIEAPWASV